MKKMSIRELRQSLDNIFSHNISCGLVSLNQMAIFNIVDECIDNGDTFVGMNIDKFDKIIKDYSFEEFYNNKYDRIYIGDRMILIVHMIYNKVSSAVLYINHTKQKVYVENGFIDAMNEIKDWNIQPFTMTWFRKNVFFQPIFDRFSCRELDKLCL